MLCKKTSLAADWARMPQLLKYQTDKPFGTYTTRGQPISENKGSGEFYKIQPVLPLSACSSGSIATAIEKIYQIYLLDKNEKADLLILVEVNTSGMLTILKMSVLKQNQLFATSVLNFTPMYMDQG